MAVIKASGFKFQDFLEVLPKKQDLAAHLAVESALRDCFCVTT